MKMNRHKPMPLKDYINLFYKGEKPKTDFANSEGVQAPQVTQWIKKNFMVVDHELMSHRRFLSLHNKFK
jgi:hypothetical protein